MKPLKENKNSAARSNPSSTPKATMLLVALFFSCGISAQIYHSAAGIRIAYGGVLSYKYSLNDHIMAEGILSVRWNGVVLTGLIERYTTAFSNPNAYWYYGGGLHLGLGGRENGINPPENANSQTYINLGMDLIGGLEYRFQKIPFSASVDYIPAFYFTGDRWFVGEGLGLSIRYIIR